MQILNLADIDEATRQQILTRDSEVGSAEVKKKVVEILKRVEAAGEQAVLAFTEQFDGVKMKSLEVSQSELDTVDVGQYGFLQQAATNIEKFHTAQLKNIQAEQPVKTEKGITVWREWRPIERVGVYAPGGRATYPSSVLMQAIPARIAGCTEIVLATPPDSKGAIPEVVLAAAKIAGVTKVIKAGGAQAIGALYYIYNVEKLTGPGNPWVTEAKQQLSKYVAIDMPAGPSEILVLADETARADFIAADLLSQAEHAPDSSSLLLTTSTDLAKQVQAELAKQVPELKRQEIVQTAVLNTQLLVAKDLDVAIEFTNSYAPEHLEIVTKDDSAVLKKIVNAGSVFLGPYSSESAGDFATGSNHVLPTAGFARNFPALSVESFGKKIQVQKLTKEGLSSIKKTCEQFGELEGLDAHARSITIRFDTDD